MIFFPINGVKIIPIHMNSVFINQFFSFNSNLNKIILETINRDLTEDEIYIFDFADIKNTIISDFVEYLAGMLPKKIFMINLEPQIYTKFITSFKEKLIEYDSQILKNCLRTISFPLPFRECPAMNNFGYIKNDLIEKCIANIQDLPLPDLSKSNLYINKKFDMRKMFVDINTVKIAVYLIAKKLAELEKNMDLGNYKLISSSFNG